jgi:hypothetical protein
MTEDQIIKEIKRRCRSFGVKFVQKKGGNVALTEGTRCAGYFDAYNEDQPQLVIAKDLSNKYFLGVLLHEYSHVTQWAENCTVWQEDMAFGDIINTDEWLGTGKKCTAKVRKAFALRRDLEADNERRTVRLIKEFNAPLDLPEYIRRANSYVHFYNTMPETNQWYHPERVPYKMPHVTKLFRSDKIDDSFEYTNKRQFKALSRCADVLRP